MKKISFDVPEMDDERGVSPVIGVILMVAITVILAAVIASFVLGFGNSVSSNANAGVNVDEGPDSVKVTWISQGNAETVNVTVTQSGESATAKLDDVSDVVTINKGNSWNPADTGNTLNITDTDVNLVVTAISGDSKTVIETTTINATSS